MSRPTSNSPSKGAVAKKKPPSKVTHDASSENRVVPRSGNRAVVMTKSAGKAGPVIVKKETILAPKGYTMRPVVPAKNYDVVSFARAMNDDFAPRVQKLFEPETHAAIIAQRTGIYIGWRCPEFKHDCQRVGDMSKCFCGHLLGEHDKYTGRSIQVPCKFGGCPCKAFAWIPSRPEDIGEFWFQRRRDFDVTKWRAKCRCTHTHEAHAATGGRQCKAKGCSCFHFNSNFLCAACDRHWEDHETFFETEDMRKMNGLPYGEDYLPFAEMPNLRNAALTGDEYDESLYQALTTGQGRPAITSNPPADNNTPVPFGQNRSGFRPVYD